MPAYADDLAFVHDAGFTALARSAADLTLELLPPGARSGPVLELGCGGGVTARRLADAGVQVHGIDLSPAQVALARRRVPEGSFEVGSALDAEPPPDCAAVIAVGEVLNYAFDPRTGTGAVRALLARLAAGLRPGGLLLFDSAGPGRAPGGGPIRDFAQGEDWAILHEAVETVDPPELVREITTFRRAGDGWRRSAETHRLRLYPPAEILDALGTAGMRTEVRAGYAGERFAPGLDVFVARRPG